MNRAKILLKKNPSLVAIVHKATVDKLNPFLGLYETSMAFVNKQKTWFESPMGTHDPRDIEAEVDASWGLVSRLEGEFSDIPSARELVVNVREKIEEFRRCACARRDDHTLHT